MMTAEHVNAFIDATKDTFSSMCQMKIVPNFKDVKKIDGAIVETDDLMAICGLSGEVKGAVFLACPLNIGKEIVGNFLMEKITEVNCDLMDGFGEIVNILAGAADGKIKNTRIDLALPSVLVGERTRFFAKAGNPFVIIPLRIVDVGPMYIGISMEVKKK